MRKRNSLPIQCHVRVESDADSYFYYIQQELECYVLDAGQQKDHYLEESMTSSVTLASDAQEGSRMTMGVATGRPCNRSISGSRMTSFIRIFSALLQVSLVSSFASISRRSLPMTVLLDAPTSMAETPAPYAGVKAVIFDVDGTLADSWKLGFDATLEVLMRNNIPPITAETYHECTRYTTPDRLARHAGLEPGTEEFLRTGNKLGEEFDDLYVDLVSTETAGFYPGVDKLLLQIPEDVKLGALTNAAHRYAHAVLKCNKVENLDVYQRFGSVRGADDVPRPKPNPEGLWQVCKDLAVDPECCVYIGDSPSDGLAAKAAGMGAIGVTWGSHSEESLRNAPFDHYCSTVDELRALLPRIAVTTV